MKEKYKPGKGFIIFEVIVALSMIYSIPEKGVGFAIIGMIIYLVMGLAVSYYSWSKKAKALEAYNQNYRNPEIQGEDVKPLSMKEYEEQMEETTRKAKEMLDAIPNNNPSSFMQMSQNVQNKKTIVSAEIIDTTHNQKSKGSVTSAVARGVVGGAILGPVGAVAGAATHKRKTVTTKGGTVRFLIRYADGHNETKDVKIDSGEYKKLIKYM